MNDQTEQIMQVLREEYDALDATEATINPAHVAARALERLDPASGAPVLVSYAAVLQYRQMARSICRKIAMVDDPGADGQSSLFDGQLQRRYPAHRSGEEVYVLREHLTLAGRRANSARLRAEAASKLQHANALDAETDALVARGYLSDAA
jgi:hypothetical protein